MRQRFYAKQVHLGTATKWRIYDSERGSFPYRTPELGVVTQDHTSQRAAETEAARLQDLLGNPTTRRTPAATAATPPRRRPRTTTEPTLDEQTDLKLLDDGNDEDVPAPSVEQTPPAPKAPAPKTTAPEDPTPKASAAMATGRGRKTPSAQTTSTDTSRPAASSPPDAGGTRKLGTAQQALGDALVAAGTAGLTATEAAAQCGVAATNAATALRKFTERGWASGDGGRPQRFTALAI